MAPVVNTNVQSLTAQRNLNTSNSLLNQALSRLAAGQRINSAAADAAGLAIATRLGVQVRLFNQAVYTVSIDVERNHCKISPTCSNSLSRVFRRQ